MGKELKYLNRKELIEIIYQLKKSEQELQAANESLSKQLETKRIHLAESGSIAEAALALTDIFAVAQASADIYLAEIAQRRAELEQEYAARKQGSAAPAAQPGHTDDVLDAIVEQRYEEIEQDYQLIIEEANRKAADIIASATAQRDAIVAETHKAYRKLKYYEAEAEKKKAELALYNAQE